MTTINSNRIFQEQRKYAWDYFQLHAEQRMRSFNFFVVIAAILSTGIVGIIKKDIEFHFVGVVLGFCLVIIPFIFWKLDQRARFLIKHAEDILKEIEKALLSEIEEKYSETITLFLSEERKTIQAKNSKKTHTWNPAMSYSNCFCCVYLVFGILGLLSCIGFLIT